jgi:pimeloyl-ACP methyl ester carboxylesterase
MFRRLAILAVRTTLFAVVAMVLLLVGCQSRIIYYPRSYNAIEVRTAERSGAQKLELQTSQGIQVAFFFPAKATEPAKPLGSKLWIVTGGNGSLALDYSYHREAWDPSASFLFFDYPGYGLSQGRPSPENIRETASALKVNLSHRFQLTAERLTAQSAVLGHSIGAAAALIVAEEWGITRAVLLTPFTTLTEMARMTVGTPLCYLNHHRFDNIARLEALQKRGGTAEIFHGTEDEVIPVAMSRELAQRFPSIIKLRMVDGAMHNDILDLAQKDIAEALR